ncbi:unnamed protein product [Echinostoma caproni]|uniref:Uncharacterized protein n=1 Tax=Echinostoma caproni TaxID=27848 RepID=A0A183AUG0_9TREM|nr:unnamed protein product [Echinostoma caproni]
MFLRQRWIPVFFRLVAISPLVREKFVQWSFFSSPDRATELLFECPYAEVRFLFGALIVYIARISSSDPCQSGAGCIRALQRACQSQAPSSLSSSLTDQNAQAARAESAASLLRAFICTNSPSDLNTPSCSQPNLTDCLLQLVLYQLRYSPAECLRQTGSNAPGTSTDPKSFSSSHMDSFNDVGYGSPGKATPGTSYSKCTGRFSSHHPLVWSQYFSIFLDYANTDEVARKRLLKLGVPELFLRYAFNNQSTLTSTTSSFGVSWLGSTTAPSSTARSADTVRQSLDRILYTVWDACLQAGQPIASTAEETYHRLSASANAVLLALTANSNNMSSCWDLYVAGLGSNTGGGVGAGGSPSNGNVQYAGVVKLWKLLSLLVRSLDVSSLIISSSTAPSLSPLVSTAPQTPPESEPPVSDTVPVPIASTELDTHPMGDTVGVVTAPTDPVAPSSSLDGTHPTVIAIDKRTRHGYATTHKNPYATSSVPLYPISQALASCLVPNSPSRSASHAIRSWLNASTLEPISSMLMSVTQYTKVVKLFMELIVKDVNVQSLFQTDENLTRWMHQWIEAIKHSLQPSSNISQSYWCMSSGRSNQAQDTMMLAQQVYKILPMTDDIAPGVSSGESEGLEEDDADRYQSEDGSHYEDPMEHEVDVNSTGQRVFFSDSLQMLNYEPFQVYLRSQFSEENAPPAPDPIALETTNGELLVTLNKLGDVSSEPEKVSLHGDHGGDALDHPFVPEPESSSAVPEQSEQQVNIVHRPTRPAGSDRPPF